jgi:hypothetical protein
MKPLNFTFKNEYFPEITLTISAFSEDEAISILAQVTVNPHHFKQD